MLVQVLWVLLPTVLPERGDDEMNTATRKSDVSTTQNMLYWGSEGFIYYTNI
jgi:hypothetical protein